ncbi:adenosine kinase [Curvivirga sp.]|uniref:adenosine kinase n=1 Tax=Curvivirga sp. TaxID=2856848 RepID=UPI003B5C7EF2
MSQFKYDLVGIGNALVDVLTKIEDNFLEAQNLPKGSMNLVDMDQSNSLYEQLPPGKEASGGSAGNTMAGFAALGGKGAFIGKVAGDQFGQVFRHDLKAMGVSFDSTDYEGDYSTGKCLVLVSPDAERTMCTYLGAANDLRPEDIDEAVITGSKVVYMEGYLYDRETAKQAFIKAAETAHKGGTETLVSLSLSDPFCVDRFRSEFRDLVKNHVDILFANEDEIMSLYEVDTFGKAMDMVRQDCKLAFLTRGSKGSVVASADDILAVPAVKVDTVVDTTGAGDQYAAGALYGYTQGHSLETCARLGNMMAGEVISHYGARLERDVKEDMAAIVAEAS